MKYLAKAGVGAAIAGCSTFLAAYAADHRLTIVNVLSGVVAGLTTFNAVYFTPYAPAPPK